MILFLYGKDTYRLQQKLREIESQYKKIHKSGLNLEKLDAGQISFREFWDKLCQSSMFIKKKLFFLANLFSNQEFKVELSEKIPEIAKSSDIVVIFEGKEIQKGDKVFFKLKKYGKSQEFKPLARKQLSDWIKREFQRYQAEPTEEALEKLIEFVGNDTWQLSNEIPKLAFFKREAKGGNLKNRKRVEIKREDVFKLVQPKIETAIFETIDALAEKNKKRALRLLEKHLKKGDSPLYLLKMINYQFRNLLIASALRKEGKNLTDLLNLNFFHPFVAKKSWYASLRFSFEELKKIYQKIFGTDLNIKTGKISPEQGIKMLISQI